MPTQAVLQNAWAALGALADKLDERAGASRDNYVEELRATCDALAQAIPPDLAWDVAARHEHRVELDRRLIAAPRD